MEQGLGKNYRSDAALQQRIQTAIAYVAAHEEELLQKPVGKYPLQEGIEIRVQSYDSREYGPMNYETHRDHVDIHYMLQGHEYMRWWDAETVEPNSKYDEKEDIIFYPHPVQHNRVILEPHHYIVFYPEDVHAAHGTVDGKVTHNHKIVVKVDVN